MASSISTASLRARLPNSSPPWCATPPMSSTRTPPADITTIICPRTSPMMPSTGCANRRLMPRTNPSSCIGHRAHPTVRIRSRRSGPTSIRASSTTAGTSIASGPLPARSSSAGFRRMRSSRRAPPPWPRGTRFPRMKSRSSAVSWKSSPALPNTPTTTRAG